MKTKIKVKLKCDKIIKGIEYKAGDEFLARPLHPSMLHVKAADAIHDKRMMLQINNELIAFESDDFEMIHTDESMAIFWRMINLATRTLYLNSKIASQDTKQTVN